MATLGVVTVIPLAAQQAENPSPVRLTIDPAATWPSARMTSPSARDDIAPSAGPAHVPLPPFVDDLLTTLTARSEMRATDAIVGAGLMAWGTRAHRSLSSVAGVGAQAIRLAVMPRHASRSQKFDIHPEVGRHCTCVSMQYQW